MVTPAMRLIYILGYMSGYMTNKVMASIGNTGPGYSERLDNGLSLGVLAYSVTCALYLDMRRRGFDIGSLRYEDLIARPLDMCRVVLEFCHLPLSLTEQAVKAFEVDSQKNSKIAKSLIGHFTEPELTPERKVKLNEMLKKFSLPAIDEPAVFEGTLSC